MTYGTNGLGRAIAASPFLPLIAAEVKHEDVQVPALRQHLLVTLKLPKPPKSVRRLATTHGVAQLKAMIVTSTRLLLPHLTAVARKLRHPLETRTRSVWNRVMCQSTKSLPLLRPYYLHIRTVSKPPLIASSRFSVKANAYAGR